MPWLLPLAVILVAGIVFYQLARPRRGRRNPGSDGWIGADAASNSGDYGTSSTMIDPVASAADGFSGGGGDFGGGGASGDWDGGDGGDSGGGDSGSGGDGGGGSD